MVRAAFYALLTERGWTAPYGSRLVRVAPVAGDGSRAGVRPALAAPAVRLRHPAR